jgi:DNA segregation ATPase FtsK/SpoIIIE, S-DNA-T family
LSELSPQPWFSRLAREVIGFIGLAMTIFFVLALLSFSPEDPGWSYQGGDRAVQNAIGPTGAWVADWSLSWFGYAAYGLALVPWAVLRRVLHPGVHRVSLWSTRLIGGLATFLGACILLALHIPAVLGQLPEGIGGGGMLGHLLALRLVVILGSFGAALLAVVSTLVGLVVLFRWHWADVLSQVGSVVTEFASISKRLVTGQRQPSQLSIEARPSWGRRLLAPLYTMGLPGGLRRTLSRVAPQPAEPDVAEIEAELLSKSTQARRAAPAISDPKAGQPEAATLPAPRRAPSPIRQRVEPHVEVSGARWDGGREPTLDDAALEALDGQPASYAQHSAATTVKTGPSIQTVSEAHTLLDGDEPVRSIATTKRVKLSKDGMQLPSLSLLEPAAPPSGKGFSEAELTQMADLLTRRLQEFGVEVDVVEINPGPVVTRFEIDPAPGIKVSRITNLAKDLARSLAVISVRVVEVIPGKSTVGIEIPNQHREMVRLSQVLDSDAYRRDDSPLTLALGHDISGEAVCTNLAKMPHLLVAGTTGSGKSVGVNSMLISMLYKAKPDALKLILVDPKMLELSVYEGIPHLLAPVVTDMKDAANALRWCVGEMERRYRLMAELGVRNLDGFNLKIRERQAAGTPLLDPLFKPEGWDVNEKAPELSTLPFIVVVIDEFADMMMIVGKKVDQLIARLAQKARAAGIHLILATQRPSVDVITGLIKANVPSRISFQVSSKIDSRTVLDQGGAEQLLGHGDMLYLPAGKPVPVRVHGAFVDDHEVHHVVEFWKQQGAPQYEDAILKGNQSDDGSSAGGFSDDDEHESDALYDEAVAFVTESRRASISAVQRKLKIGYNRAARMIEAMEAAGVVSEMGHNGAREVLAPPPR